MEIRNMTTREIHKYDLYVDGRLFGRFDYKDQARHVGAIIARQEMQIVTIVVGRIEQ